MLCTDCLSRTERYIVKAQRVVDRQLWEAPRRRRSPTRVVADVVVKAARGGRLCVHVVGDRCAWDTAVEFVEDSKSLCHTFFDRQLLGGKHVHCRALVASPI